MLLRSFHEGASAPGRPPQRGAPILAPETIVLVRVLALLAALGLALPYLVYPALLVLLGWGWGRDEEKEKKKRREKGGEAPLRPLSLVLSFVNEGALLKGRIENLFDTEYPAELVEVVAVSDGADATSLASLREAAAGRPVRILEAPKGLGKTACQNAAAEAARGEILVFTDANTRFTPTTLPLLVRALEDPAAGCAAGRLAYEGDGAGETAYWSFESWLRDLEGRIASPVGAHGAVYALRKADYVPLPPEAMSDLVEPLMQGLIHGRSTVHVPEALAFETPPRRWGAIYRRKRRIFLRAWRSLPLLAPLGNPLRHPLPSLFFIGHKLLRWTSFLFIGVLALTLPLLHPGALWAEAALLALAAPAALLGLQALPFTLPLYLLCLFAAQASAFVGWLRGEAAVRWVPQHG